MKYEKPPTFYKNTPVSSIDLEILRQNTINLYKTAVNTQPPTVQRNKDHRNQGPTGNNNSGITGNGWENFYHGAFMYHEGIDTLHIEGKITVPTQTGNDQIKVYIFAEGAWQLLDTKSYAPNTTNTLSLSYDISGYTFFEGEIVKVQIDYDKAGAPAQYPPSITEIYGVFVDTLKLQDAWPTLPTLSGSNALSEANLNQLSACIDWLYRRIKLVPIYHTLATVHATLSFTRDAGTTVYWAYPDQSMYSGGALSANNHNRYTVKGFSILKDARERYILYLNGTPVDYWPSSTSYSDNYTAVEWELSHDMPANSIGAFRVGNQLTSNTGGNDDPTTGKGRTRHYMYTYMTNSSTLPNALGTSLDFTFNRNAQTYTSLLASLNAVKDGIQAIYNHIVANPLVFDRAYIVRPIVFERTGDNLLNKPWSVPMFPSRKGDLLYISGSNVSIGYGPLNIDSENKWEFQFTEQVITGEGESSTFINLDSLTGLYNGMQYFVYGDTVNYVAEYYE